jgi:hypothetical protein
MVVMGTEITAFPYIFKFFKNKTLLISVLATGTMPPPPPPISDTSFFSEITDFSAIRIRKLQIFLWLPAVYIYSAGARSSVVVKAICYKLQGLVFETR